MKTIDNYWLVVLTILKKYLSVGKDDIPYIMETKKCSKSAPSYIMF